MHRHLLVSERFFAYVTHNSVAQTQALQPPSSQLEAMGNRAAKPAAGPPAEGGAPNSAATGCMAIPQRFCGTCFHCIAVGFGFTYDMSKLLLHLCDSFSSQNPHGNASAACMLPDLTFVICTAAVCRLGGDAANALVQAL